MAYIDIPIPIDEDLKWQAELMLDALGLDMNTAINIFLKQVIREGGIPFMITTRPTPVCPLIMRFKCCKVFAEDKY